MCGVVGAYYIMLGPMGYCVRMGPPWIYFGLTIDSACIGTTDQVLTLMTMEAPMLQAPIAETLTRVDPCSPCYVQGYNAGWEGKRYAPPMHRGTQAQMEYSAGYNTGMLQRNVNPVRRRGG